MSMSMSDMVDWLGVCNRVGCGFKTSDIAKYHAHVLEHTKRDKEIAESGAWRMRAERLLIDWKGELRYKCDQCEFYTGVRDEIIFHLFGYHRELDHLGLLESDSQPPLPPSQHDAINPSYYHGRRVMEFINEFKLSFCLGTVVKYITRAKLKNGVEDLTKAIWYLEEEIRVAKIEKLKGE